MGGVYLTFDVECSMGGAWGNPALQPVTPQRAIWGRYGNRQMGLPLICDTLVANGLAATFFLDPFLPEQGYPYAGEEICRYLLNRGQDVQLHVHPNHKHFGLKRQGRDAPFTDKIADLPPQAQLDLLAEGADRIEAWTGRRPSAFRAGNMSASEATLQQLPTAGLKIDSSYVFCYAGGQCRFSPEGPYNGSKWYGPVLELALSGFRQVRLPGLHPSKPLDLVGISFSEAVAVIERIHAAGADAVAILHSFSLFKVRDVQYAGGRPNWVVTGRFRRLCRWLASRRDGLAVRTFSQLADDLAANRYEARAVEPPLLRRPVRALARKALQGINRWYWV